MQLGAESVGAVSAARHGPSEASRIAPSRDGRRGPLTGFVHQWERLRDVGGDARSGASARRGRRRPLRTSAAGASRTGTWGACSWAKASAGTRRRPLAHWMDAGRTGRGIAVRWLSPASVLARVVQAGGESKGIRRRDWPVVSCRAEPPLARCDGSQTLGTSRPKVSKVIAAAGTAVGQNPTVMRRPGHGGTLRAAPRQALAALAAGREFADRRLGPRGKAACR